MTFPVEDLLQMINLTDFASVLECIKYKKAANLKNQLCTNSRQKY